VLFDGCCFIIRHWRVLLVFLAQESKRTNLTVKKLEEEEEEEEAQEEKTHQNALTKNGKTKKKHKRDPKP
jgi:hypothetical protein